MEIRETPDAKARDATNEETAANVRATIVEARRNPSATKSRVMRGIPTASAGRSRTR
jgi:hypothetical protein